MKRWYVDRVDESAEQTCRWCGTELAWVEDIGWVDRSNGSYDLCAVHPYGNHEITARTPPPLTSEGADPTADR